MEQMLKARAQQLAQKLAQLFAEWQTAPQARPLLAQINGILAQCTYINNLIDDIDAELDARRITLLLDHIEGKMQVFISTSKRAIASHYQTSANCQYISQGSVVSQSQLTPLVAHIDSELALKATALLSPLTKVEVG